MKQTTLEEKSAGGVVFRKLRKLGVSDNQSTRDSEKIEFLIGKHSGYHKWALPKGLVEKGESESEAAEREVEEEVGVRAEIVSLVPLKIIEYWFYADLEETKGKTATGDESTRRVRKYQEDGASKTRIHKSVTFYLMNLVRDLGVSGWEMETRRWVSYEEGLKLLAFETEKEVFTEAWKSLSAPAET